MAEQNQFGYDTGKYATYQEYLDEVDRINKWYEEYKAKKLAEDPNYYDNLEPVSQEWQDNYYGKKADEWNKFGSNTNYTYDPENGYLQLDWQLEGDKYGEGGYLSELHNVSDSAYRQALAFENGQVKWQGLEPGVQAWYLKHFDPKDIVADADDDGNTITVAEIENISVEQPTDPVATPPEGVITLPGTGIETDPVISHEEAKPTTPGEAPDPVTSTIDLNPVVPEVNVGTPENPTMAPTINVPGGYEYHTYGFGKKPEGTTTGYQPVGTSHLLSTASKQNNTGQVLGVGMKWVLDPLTGQFLQVEESDPRPAAFNKGGAVKNYNEGGEADTAVDFTADGLNKQLASSLGDLYDFYDDAGNLPAWYGTQYNEDTGKYDQVNSQGQTQAEWVAAGGDPNAFQGLNPVAGFNKTQVAGQDALINASNAQGTLAQNLGDAVQTGLSGGYGYQANLQTPTTLGDAKGYQAQNYSPSTIDDVKGYGAAQVSAAQQGAANTYNPSIANAALQGNANYVNQYLNPAVQQAQQAAIANVNAGFGQGGTLGGARNARAASQAAVQASLPTLTQGAQQEFAAQQAINAANQNAQNQFGLANQAAQNQAGQFGAAAQNQIDAANTAAQNQIGLSNAAAQNTAAQFGASAANQAGFQNQAAQNQAAQFNAQANTAANQYGANVGNQFAQQNAAILNQADAANAAAANAASQYNLNNISNWAGVVPAASQQFLNQGNTLQQVGQQQYDLGQQQINQDVQAWNYLQNLPAQQLYNQLHLGQLAQAGQSDNIGTDIGGSNSSPFDFSNLLNLGIQGAGGGGGLGSLLGGLFGANVGGMVPGKAGLMRRRG